MAVIKYKDPKTGEIKKVGVPQIEGCSEAEVDAKLTTHTNRKDNPHEVTLSQIGAAPAYTYGTTELIEGVSTLETGKLYFVYE